MLKDGGVFVPSGLLKNIYIKCSLDNIDAKVDTSDGCAPKDSSRYISI